jgi:hypothetical protein
MKGNIILGEKKVSRLILGGNPISGFSHISPEKDREMIDYYTSENIMRLFDECRNNGVNTIQSRGDRHMQRILHEYWSRGNSDFYWIGQTASELEDISANIRRIADCGAIAIYHHGTKVDNLWHEGRIDEVEEVIQTIRDTGLPAGLGTHIPEVIDYVEQQRWPVDFYMTSMYNLAKEPKHAQAVEGFKREEFNQEDPSFMLERVRRTSKPCLAFKILGAGRFAGSSAEVREAFKKVFAQLKPSDAVVVGMFQKYQNQVGENAEVLSEIL